MFDSFRLLCSSGDEHLPNDDFDASECLIVNVYDMRAENKWSSVLGVGVWHTGIQLYGAFEVTFGGHPGNFTGVFTMPPRSVPLPIFESINMGRLTKSPADVRQILEQIATDYPGNSYHILNRNCNHFSNDLVVRLLGRPLPSYINRLAGLVSLVKCVLPQSLRGPHFEDPELVAATSDPALATPGECTHCRCRSVAENDALRNETPSPFYLGGEDMVPEFADEEESDIEDPAMELLRQVFFPTFVQVSS